MDYKDFEKGNRTGTAPSAGYWWDRPAEDVCKGVMAAAHQAGEAQLDRQQLNLRCARLYGNFDFLGWGAKEYSTSASFSPLQKSNQISWNLIASCVDTLDAKLSKTTPRPMFLTAGGEWSKRMAAKKLDVFVRGFFYETKAQELLARQTKDAFILDMGIIHAFVDKDTNRVALERVLAPELRWDDAEAIYGQPRQLFRVKTLPKEVVKATWGRKDGNNHLREDIATALSKAGRKEWTQGSFGVDMVEVVEAWHLPSSEKADDGMHALCIEGANLILPEKWKKTRFPFSFFKFSDRLQGFSGQSLAERLTGRQLEINRTLTAISEVLRRKGRGRWFVPKGSKVILSHLTNGMADLVEYDGPTPPTHDAAPALSVEDVNYLRTLWSDGFEESGISQLSASAKNPFGADPSGKAIELYNDIESERFIMVGKRREAVSLDLTELVIDLVKDVVEAGKGGKSEDYEMTCPEKGGMEHIKWSEIDLERDDYVMQGFPVSSLPQTPAAKLAYVEKLGNMGVFGSQAEMLRLMDFPDITAENNLALAALDYVDAFVGRIIEGKEGWESEVYDPYCNLELLVSRGQNAYLRAKLQGCPEDRLDKLRTQLNEAAEAVAAAQAPPAPPPGPPMLDAGAPMPMDAGMPPGPPGPPPGPDMGMPPGGPPPGLLPQ